MEVAGQRAEVIVANPSGIRANGATFLNASRVTLTTGTPVLNSGNLESFRVIQGSVVVEGLGLDTRTADYTTIMARAAEINAGLWAQHLKVVTGANTVSADASTVTATPASAQGPAPRFMLDVAAIGGMYAGHIYLVGTEAGLGVNNGGTISADTGDLVIDSDGWLRNKGRVLAKGDLSIQTASVENTAGGEISAGATTGVTVTGDLNNRGLIDGKTTQVKAETVNNIGTGRLYGGVLAIQADTLRNDTETVNGVRADAVIAARERLDIGAQTLINREGATILSLGDMAIGGTLDANNRASGMARTIQNQSATIEALGNLSIATQTLENSNQHFTYKVVPVAGGGTAKVDYYTPSGYVGSNEVAWNVDGYGEGFSWSEWDGLMHSNIRILLKNSAYAAPVYRDIYLGPVPYVEGHYETRHHAADDEYQVWVPYVYGHDRDSPIWAALGMTPPAWSNPGQKPRTVRLEDERMTIVEPDPAAVADWEAKVVPWVELSAKYKDFRTQITRDLIHVDIYRSYTEIEQRAEVTASQPARIVSGAELNLNVGQNALNQDSHIIAGGGLNVSGVSVNNQATQVNAPILRNGTLSTWAVVGQDCDLLGCSPKYGWVNATYSETIPRTVSLPSIRYEPNAGTGQAPVSTGAAAAVTGTALPSSGMFKLLPGSTATYLVETDPRLTEQRQWLSSDYLLQAMSIDPATVQKRLGDGFYEQRLVREQLAALTGRRFLGNFTNDDAQYQALMTNGATFAQAFQLRPGIALTAAQVAQLTSDIVWLVTETVTLPDGSTAQVLVPRVYALPRAGDLTETGALLSGQTVQLDLSGDLTNAGTLNGRQLTRITAQNVHNLGGRLGGGQSTRITARQDINNIGGSIAALDQLRLDADRDITVRSTTSQGRGNTGQGVYSSQGIDRVAGLYVSKQAGVLIANAQGNANLTGALIQSAGSVQVDAKGSITLGTLQTGASMNATRDERNFTRIEHIGEVGTQVQAAGAINLKAGQDVNARAATVQAGGVLDVQAERNVNITAGEQSLSIDTATYARARSGLNSGSTERKDQRSDTTALSSSLGGEQVNIQSGQHTAIWGSSVIGDEGVTVQAVGDVDILATQTRHSASHFLEQKSSGLFVEGAGFTYGSQQQSTDQDQQGTGSVASTVGAIGGDVRITAGQGYTQVGSDVFAPGGDIDIIAQAVQITEARSTSRREVEQRFEKSGITLALNAPGITAMETANRQLEAADDTKDGRMKGLAAANIAFAGNNAVKAIEDAQSKPDANAAEQAGMSVSISIGASSSQSKTLETHDTARGSTLSAAGSVSITASGQGQDSDILIQGSEVNAGHTASLNAEGDVKLLAAQNTASLTGSNKSDSGSIGISLGTGGFGVSVSASSARGKEAGDDLTQTNTHITAGNKVRIKSENDTTLQGALVKADAIEAEVGGDLKIESLQDTSTYDSKQSSVSASVTIGMGGSGSFSASKSKVNSDFASVAEQSGFKAGDGGFRVHVQGDTELIGGTIASNQAAVEQGINSFTTGGELSTRDIQNQADYSASSTSVGVGGGVNGQKKGMNGMGVGVGSDSGHASSTTTAGISGIAGDTAIRSTDAEAGIARIFEKERVQKEIEAQTRITEMFGREASKAIGDYAATQMKRADSLHAQANAEADPDKQAHLSAQADQLENDWGNNGKLRLLAHTVVGGLTGGASGALGAATGTLAAPAVADALASAGIDGALAKTLTAIASTVVGVTAGGTAGGAAALNEVANNYLKHADVEKLSKQLKACGADKTCRDQAFEEAYRVSVANDIALLNCKSTANCDALKAEFRLGYEAIGRMLDAGIKPDDVSLVLNLETNAQTIIRNGLDQIQCNTPACKDKANHLVGIGKGLAKVTPAGLVTGSGVMAYELTTALLNIGLTDTAVAVVNGIAGLPADIRNRLNSSDPQVRGEALVDALAIGTVATAVTGKLGQLGYATVVKQVEAKAARATEAEAIAKAKVDNNSRVDDGQQYDQFHDAKGTDWDWQRQAPNGGAVPGTAQTSVVKAGGTLDRYGSRRGTYLSPADTPFEQRALPPGKQADPYEKYTVLKEFTVLQEEIAPAFNQPGGGVQLRARIPEVENRYANVNDLINFGYLKDPKGMP